MQAYTAYWQHVTEVLGWTLLHFLWQGALIAALYALVRHSTQRPTARYLLGMLTLLVMALAPALTAWQIWQRPALLGIAPGAQAASRAFDRVLVTSVDPQLIDTLLPWLGAMWLAGVLLLSLNSLRHWRRMHWLLHHSACAVPQWEYALQRLRDRFAIWPNVRLLQSAHVVTPTLIGWLKPIILLPTSVLGGFTPQQIEMILAHELGHVRRWDYLANLFQVALETVLFYHPAVHWVSRDVRNVRETCCDDLVIGLGCGTPLAYAHTLANLEGLRATLPAPALAATGGMLLARVRRIVGVEHTVEAGPLRQHGWLVMLVLLMTLVLGARLGREQHSVLDIFSALRLVPAQVTQQAYALISHNKTLPTPTPAAAVPPPPPASSQVVASRNATAAPAAAANNAPAASVATLLLPARPAPSRADTGLAALATPALQVHDIAAPRLALQLSDPAPAAATMPQLLRRVAPAYPAGARQNDEQGQVSLSFSIGVDGSVQDIEVSSARGAEDFTVAAIDALRQWTFVPESVPVGAARYTQAFDFALGRSKRAAIEDANCKYSTGSHICRRDTQ